MGNLKTKENSLGEVGFVCLIVFLFFFSFWNSSPAHGVHGDCDMTHSANFLAFLPAMISQDFKGGDN